MKKKNIHNKIIIIGSGPAGYTAAIYSARANLNPIIITGNIPGGQLTNTNSIENWPGDEKILTGFNFIKRLKKHALKFNTKIINDHIIDVNFNNTPFKLIGENFQYTSDSIIIATGSVPKYLGLKSESLFLGKGVSTCAVCDGFFYKDKIVAVIGGGNTALEEALYLSNISKKIHLIHRREFFRAEKILINKVLKKIKNKKIIFHSNSKIEKILGKDNKVNKLKIFSKKNKRSFYINVSGVFIAIGNIPNTKIFNKKIKMKNGYIVLVKNIQNYYSQTNIPGIFAAGDVIYNSYRQAITASAGGCIASLDSEKYLESL
ncbi:MAG: thioredoxin-disulfide reductase [Buchnera aphidicola (Periphyllus lyropictus)]|uniref:thioredoxin-disulfide reductase n=1 Tax=Buchnera aphidicola TaxID=9 RepID=UPI001EBE6564|nr:thioredoxin-disulfide reductase [Buchnera aphidicola]NIH16820.1 thioredoxin-disulfide reductase [Buchnera aphidicola (Periphyllus lyropictus)]USS94502.1 thioredoxin-disulfide reductase [Buchnera aphidicola (Periphyllus lyropictus)]